MIKDAVANYVASKSAITDLLSTYDFGSGDEPAIFLGMRIPDDASYPCIFITQIRGGVTFGARGFKGGDVAIDIQVFDDKTFDSTVLDNLSEELWKNLNHGNLDSYLTAQGFTNWGVRALPPADLTDEDTFPGYVVRLNVRVTEY